jgi:integrase
MPTIKLTQPAVEKLKPPQTGRVEYFDKQLPAFALRITATGHKSWIVMYRVEGKLVRETLGTVALIPKVDKARQLARESMRQAQAGIHPVKARRAAQTAVADQTQTFAVVADLFLDRYAKRNTREATYMETMRIVERDAKPAWGSRSVRSIARRDVIELLDGIVDRGAPIQANRTLAAVRRLFNWAAERELVETNPAAGLTMPSAENARDRALSDDEIRLFWRASEAVGWPFGPMFRLLLLTGQRREETAAMEWSELNLTKRVWTIPRQKAKNERAHEVHLSDLALEVIGTLPRIAVPVDEEGKARSEHGYVFTTNGLRPVSGFSRAKGRLGALMLEARRREQVQAGDDLDQALIGEWTLHDLRRTAATGMARLNIAPHVVDRILNHVSGTIRGVAAVYNRHAYMEERKAALEAWGRYVENLVRPVGGNVVDLATALTT